jgi:hypothetical protein
MTETLRHMSGSLEKETDDLGHVRLRHVQTLIELLATSTMTQKDHIRRRYGERASHFEATLQFVLRLGCIQDNGQRLSLDNSLEEASRYGAGLRQELVRRISATTSPFHLAMTQYVAQFQVIDGRIAYRPIVQRTSDESGLRNLLMELQVVAHSEAVGEYVLHADFLSFYLRAARNTSAIAPERLTARLAASEEIGLAAEQAVLSYERRRLGESHSSYVKHIAETDAAAGYDIESVTMSAEATVLPRLIEVKAVPAANLRFFWTSNEVAAARRFSDWYHLYLVPVRCEGQIDPASMVIVSNPYRVIIKGDGGWRIDADILRCELAEGCIPQLGKVVVTS